MIKRLLKVAIVGAPNAGKSTLLNHLVGSEVSSVSRKVHTTRKNVLGVFTQDETQLEFHDSPGVVTRQHLLKHRLEDSLLKDPEVATVNCDLIAVIVDVSNIREQRRLNKGLLSLLMAHGDKESILVMNKVDLVKEKRQLLDIGTRLTQGCIDGRLTMNSKDLSFMSRERLIELNLLGHVGNLLQQRKNRQLNAKEMEKQEESIHVMKTITQPKKHKHVTVLGSSPESLPLEQQTNNNNDNSTNVNNRIFLGEDQLESPDSIGYKNFSQIFSISALTEDGVDELREYLLSKAKLVERWPHGPDYITNQNTQDIVHGIIRGKVMDYVENAVPYLLEYKYLLCKFDEFGSLHVHLTVKCPGKYMVSKVLGEKGVIVSRITHESREIMSRVLCCDVKLNIAVDAATQ